MHGIFAGAAHVRQYIAIGEFVSKLRQVSLARARLKLDGGSLRAIHPMSGAGKARRLNASHDGRNADARDNDANRGNAPQQE
jgi:hypothetical protein